MVTGLNSVFYIYSLFVFRPFKHRRGFSCKNNTNTSHNTDCLTEYAIVIICLNCLCSSDTAMIMISLLPDTVSFSGLTEQSSECT